MIDKDFHFTPGKPIGRTKMCYPDHYAILFKMKNIPLSNGKSPSNEKFKMWNLNKEDGWKNFHALTEENENLRKIIVNDAEDSTKLMGNIDTELTKVKFRVFGKVTVRNELRTTKELKNLQKEKFEILKSVDNTNERDAQIKTVEDKITTEVLSRQRLKLEKELKNLKDVKSKKGKSAVVFKLKDTIVGRKKAGQETTTMKDPLTDEVLTTREKIKEASLKYCVDLLTNRDPREGFEEDLEMKNLIHEVRMN
jgi:hypothetical protein